MRSFFYSHLIEIETITSELGKMDLSEEEKLHLAELIDSSLHHTILDAILSQLQDQDKRVFLRHVTSGDDLKIWNFLNGKIEGVEEKIKKAAESLKGELHKDLREVTKKQW